MKLNESVQEDIIEAFQNVKNIFDEFWSACNHFSNVCEGNENLKREGSYLADYCKEITEKLANTEDAILDEYYPIDYADDEEDYTVAGERYRTSKEQRENVFR